VGPRDVLEHFDDADEVLCIMAPTDFRAVGKYYADFEPTSDDTVIALLREADARMSTRSGRESATLSFDADVEIPVGDVVLMGNLRLWKTSAQL
jgi:hypothetical protein